MAYRKLVRSNVPYHSNLCTYQVPNLLHSFFFEIVFGLLILFAHLSGQR